MNRPCPLGVRGFIPRDHRAGESSLGIWTMEDERKLAIPIWIIAHSSRNLRWLFSGKMGLAEVITPIFTSEKFAEDFIAENPNRREYVPMKINSAIEMIGLLAVLEKMEFRCVTIDHFSGVATWYPIADARREFERIVCD